MSERAAGELGLRTGIAVGSGVIDAYAGWIGTVGAKADLDSTDVNAAKPDGDVSQAFTRLAAVAGTSTCHLAIAPQQIFAKGIWGPYRDVLLHGYWMAEGGQSATGELLKYVVETHPSFQQAMSQAMSSSLNIYDFLNKSLQEMVEKASAPSVSWLGRHFFFYGDLFGNRSPIADPAMTGAIVGLTNDKTSNSLSLHYYGAMEFIALQTRQIIETMNRAGHRIKSIFMSGSQCQNHILMGLIATVCGMPVVLPNYVHAAVVHGAAMLGAKAATADEHDKTEDLWSVMRRMSGTGTVVMPRKDAGEGRLLEAKYQVFLEQCESQQTYRRKVDESIRGWRW